MPKIHNIQPTPQLTNHPEASPKDEGEIMAILERLCHEMVRTQTKVKRSSFDFTNSLTSRHLAEVKLQHDHHNPAGEKSLKYGSSLVQVALGVSGFITGGSAQALSTIATGASSAIQPWSGSNEAVRALSQNRSEQLKHERDLYQQSANQAGQKGDTILEALKSMLESLSRTKTAI